MADRSLTTIENAPAESPLDGRNVLAEPAIDAVAFVGAAGVTGAGVGVGGGGAATAPTVKLPFICDECGSHWKKYVPSVSVTVNVLSPTNSTSVATAAPGPEKSKLWNVEWSWMTSVYVPGSRCLTWRARRVRERDREGVVQRRRRR